MPFYTNVAGSPNLQGAMNFTVRVGTPRNNVLGFAEKVSNGDLDIKMNILESFSNHLTFYRQFDRAEWTQQKIDQIKEEKMDLDSIFLDAEFIGDNFLEDTQQPPSGRMRPGSSKGAQDKG